ncbi:hypothetical protein QBZ16_000720 [Prototheca wickerhamii]|uniref:J domain-containing protein n=1 Tax=Prototheca wickerhamii TaxID=3111 RepID=A0AAD9MPC0_PROWI|nr:hypothetical protein QBZ16_000720 [Prototheca wickerhamii]
MRKNYYAVLGLARGCRDESEIKKAYHALAIKHHPDKAGSGRRESEERFQEIREAYENLIDARKRRAYELEFESQALGVSGAGLLYAAFASGLGECQPPRKRVHTFLAAQTSAWAGFSACSSAFQEAFGADLAEAGVFGRDEGEGLGPETPPATAPMPAASPVRPPKDPPVEVPLPCSLEELYQGVTKRLRIDRTTPERRSEVVAVRVLPGWGAGTRITLPERGDERPGRVPADIVFVVAERPHARFARRGRDLEYRCRIDLADALCGCELSVPTLDGRELPLLCSEVVRSGEQRRLRGEGMPAGLERGDLIVTFEVDFPARLDVEAKTAIRAALQGLAAAGR